MTQIEEFMTLLPDLFHVRPSNGVTKPKLRSCLDEVDRISRSPAGLRSTQLALAILRQCKHHLGKEEIGFSAGTLFSSQGAAPGGGPAGKEKRRAKSTGER